MSIELLNILKRAIVTERATLLKEQDKYVFAVELKATKGQIRQAVETQFKVDVLAVNTARMTGKMRRRGAQVGYTSDWKKAIVTVKHGQEIKLPESQA